MSASGRTTEGQRAAVEVRGEYGRGRMNGCGHA